MREHNHYFKNVNDVKEVDVYHVCQLFGIKDTTGAVQHAIKKLLLSGQRGAGKNYLQDIKEAKDSLVRKLELEEKDVLEVMGLTVLLAPPSVTTVCQSLFEIEEKKQDGFVSVYVTRKLYYQLKSEQIDKGI